MENKKLLQEIIYDCPFCDKEHNIQIFSRNGKSLVKGETVEYEETYYYCSNEDDEFVPSKIMDDNIVKSIDAYRKSKGLLTSQHIKEIRQEYDLTQKEFSNMLGWGDITIQRYEKKLIQDETYDNIIKMIGENPSYALYMLQKHKSLFVESKYNMTKLMIKNKIKEKGNHFLCIQAIQNQYIDYDQECDSNGYKLLDIEKLQNVMAYFANFVSPLHKVKMMKLLWFADSSHYKNFCVSMTGLVYLHKPYGALPIAYNELMGLPSIKVFEEYVNENVAFRIEPNKNVSINSFTLEEFGILEKVANHFKNYSTNEIVNYMHDEKAYLNTKDEEVIPYSLAKEIREF